MAFSMVKLVDSVTFPVLESVVNRITRNNEKTFKITSVRLEGGVSNLVTDGYSRDVAGSNLE